MSLWERLRGAYRRRRKRRGETAGEKLALERERQERANVDPETPIPPMRQDPGYSGPF